MQPVLLPQPPLTAASAAEAVETFPPLAPALARALSGAAVVVVVASACPLSAGSASVTSFADTPLARAAVAYCAAPPLKQAVVGAGAGECGMRTQRRRRTMPSCTQCPHPVAAARRPMPSSSMDLDVHGGAGLMRARSCLFGAALFALLAAAAAAADATAATALVDYTNYTLSAAR